MAGASVINIDIIENARWHEQDGLVVEIGRLAIISNLDPILTTPRDFLFVLARAQLGLPSNGASHPWQPTLKLRERDFTAMGHGIVHAMLKYKRDDLGAPSGVSYVLRGGSSSEQIETQLDRAGNQIIVSHQGKQQGGEIHPYEVRSEIQASWLEQSQFPGDFTRTYANKVNNGVWTLDLTAPARTWHCRDISFDPENSQLSPPQYRFTASFTYNPDMFDPQVVYIDPETGKPPPMLVAGQGYKTIPWYEEADFSAILP